jgi:hypothetical protein
MEMCTLKVGKKTSDAESFRHMEIKIYYTHMKMAM